MDFRQIPFSSVLSPVSTNIQSRSNCQALIRWQLNRIPAAESLGHEDRQEIEQEISLHVWKKLEQFDPRQGRLSTYISRIVSRKFIDLLRSQSTQSRRPSTRHFSMEGSADEDPGALLGARISTANLRRHRGVPPQREDLSQLQLDVETCLEQLPADLKEICQLLDHFSATETARRLGIARSTLYERIHVIRSRFSDASLDAYL